MRELLPLIIRNPPAPPRPFLKYTPEHHHKKLPLATQEPGQIVIVS